MTTIERSHCTVAIPATPHRLQQAIPAGELHVYQRGYTKLTKRGARYRELCIIHATIAAASAHAGQEMF